MSFQKVEKFLSDLESGDVKKNLALTGLVRASRNQETSDCVEFSRDGVYWAKIPADMIKDFEVKGAAEASDELYDRVTIILKEPTGRQAKILADLIRQGAYDRKRTLERLRARMFEKRNMNGGGGGSLPSPSPSPDDFEIEDAVPMA